MYVLLYNVKHNLILLLPGFDIHVLRGKKIFEKYHIMYLFK
jgi:hypothetical protein